MAVETQGIAKELQGTYVLDEEPPTVNGPEADGAAEDWTKIKAKRLPPSREAYLRQRYFLIERKSAWRYVLTIIAVLAAIFAGIGFVYEGAKKKAEEKVTAAFGGLSASDVKDKVDFILAEEARLKEHSALARLDAVEKSLPAEGAALREELNRRIQVGSDGAVSIPYGTALPSGGRMHSLDLQADRAPGSKLPEFPGRIVIRDNNADGSQKNTELVEETRKGKSVSDK